MDSHFLTIDDQALTNHTRRTSQPGINLGGLGSRMSGREIISTTYTSPFPLSDDFGSTGTADSTHFAIFAALLMFLLALDGIARVFALKTAISNAAPPVVSLF